MEGTPLIGAVVGIVGVVWLASVFLRGQFQMNRARTSVELEHSYESTLRLDGAKLAPSLLTAVGSAVAFQDLGLLVSMIAGLGMAVLAVLGNRITTTRIRAVVAARFER